MKKIRAIALDDEQPALEIIETFCENLEFIDLRKTFTKRGEAELYLEEYPVDLLFLDINMPSVSGIEFFKTIQQNPMVIFTTAYAEYAVESFELNAVDYLLKPYTFGRFQQAVQRAFELFKFYSQSKVNEKKYLFLRVDYSLAKIDTEDIIFIEGLDNYLKIHLQNQKPLVVRITMKTMLEKLNSDEFIRVHRSYIIPIKKIIAVRNKFISIGGEEVPLGSSFEEDFYKIFEK